MKKNYKDKFEFNSQDLIDSLHIRQGDILFLQKTHYNDPLIILIIEYDKRKNGFKAIRIQEPFLKASQILTRWGKNAEKRVTTYNRDLLINFATRGKNLSAEIRKEKRRNNAENQSE